MDLAAVMGGGACASVAWGARTASPLQGSEEENHSEAWYLGTRRPRDPVQEKAQSGG